jgi:hypothetical protein
MKIKIKLILILSLVLVFSSHLALAKLFKPEKRLINAKTNVVWKNMIKFFPKKEIKIKRVNKHKYLIEAERKITRQSRFSRDITIKLIPKDEQTIVSFSISTFIGSAGFGHTRKIIEDFLDKVQKASEQ